MCMACCSGAAPDPHAATSRDYGGKLLGSTAQRGAGCGVQCTRSAATGGECERAVCADGAISATIRYAPPQGKAVLVGSAPERADDDAIREERRPSPKSVRYKRAVGRLRISRPREPTCGCSFAANLLDRRSLSPRRSQMLSSDLAVLSGGSRRSSVLDRSSIRRGHAAAVCVSLRRGSPVRRRAPAEELPARPTGA